MFGKEKIIKMGKAQDKATDDHIKIFDEAVYIGKLLGKKVFPSKAGEIDPLSYPPFVDITFTGKSVAISYFDKLGADKKTICSFEIEYEYFGMTDQELTKVADKTKKQSISNSKQSESNKKAKGKKK